MQQIDRSRRRKWGLVALAFLPLFMALAFNGTRGLWGTDEGRYVDGGLQMLRMDDFLRIHLNPEYPHFTKPPVTYWAIAGSIAAFGQNESAARLPNALAFWGTSLLLLLAGRLIGLRAPWVPMLLYATTLFTFFAANAVTTDTLLALFTTLAGVSFLALYLGKRPRLAAVAMWSGFGLAFMTKGPPGLLPLLAFNLFLVFNRDWSRLKTMWWSWGIPAFLLIGFSWYAALVLTTPGLLDYFIHDEVVGRVASNEFGRHGQWYGAIVAYLPVWIFGALPWGYFLLFARKRAETPEDSRAEVSRLLAWWVLVPFVIFVLARSRLPIYTLQLFAPATLWLSLRLEPLLRRPWPRWGYALVALWIAGAVGFKAWAAHYDDYGRDARALAQEIVDKAGNDFQEIVFVNMMPKWGLTFYLNEDVEETWLGSPRERPSFAPVQSLPQELAEGRAEAFSDWLFVVRPPDRERFEQTVHESGRGFEFMGELKENDDQLLYRVDTAAGAGAASDPGSQ